MVVVFLVTTCLMCFSTASEALINRDNNACTRLLDYPIKSFSKNCYMNPNVMSRTPNMIEQNGYKFESYTITTPDGYILTLFRIPPDRNDNRRRKQPVILQHGIVVDSATWVDIGNRSLAFNLVDEGYDVWLTTVRGTRYSRTHISFKDSDFEYWNYSIDTLAVNDLRSNLNQVADITGKKGSTVYIGHSLGTILILMFASEYPEEAQNLLRGIIVLSPIAYFDMRPPINLLFKSFDFIGNILLQFGISAVFYNMEDIFAFWQNFCPLFPHVCRFLIAFWFGKTYQLLPDDLLTFFSNIPTTGSVKEFMQISQMVNSRNFQKFDFGAKKNLIEYGQRNPPLYKLENINLPVTLFYSSQDPFLTEMSVRRTLTEIGAENNEMRHVPLNSTEKEDQFSHTDFVFAKELKKLFYTDLFHVLKNKFSV